MTHTAARSHVDAIPQPRPSRGVLRWTLLALFGLALAALVVVHSLAAFLADGAPEAALRLSPGHPTALNNFAQQEISRPRDRSLADAASSSPSLRTPTFPIRKARPDDNGISVSLTQEEVAEIRGRVERALAQNPLSARSIRILGQLADVDGDRETATRLLELAVRRSKHESLAVYLMLRRSVDKGDWPSAIFYGDLGMRTRPELIDVIAGPLVEMAETPGGIDVLNAMLATNPEWRRPFLLTMLRHVKNAATPLTILLHLKTSKHPPEPEDIRQYLGLLVQAQVHSAAYYARLQLMPPEQLAKAGLVLNGDFQLPTSDLPFEWTWTPSTSASIEIARVPDDDTNRALRIEFGAGRVQVSEVQQRLMLPAGSYRASARYRGEVMGRRGMKIVVSCAIPESSAQLGESPVFIGKQATWRTWDFIVNVPPSCPTQMLRIRHDARFASEQFVNGLFWLDDVRIVRNETIE